MMEIVGYRNKSDIDVRFEDGVIAEHCTMRSFTKGCLSYPQASKIGEKVLAGGGLFDSNQRWCRRQVERGITDVLGTDMHRTDFRPPDTPGAQKWLKKALSPEHFDVLTRRNALHIIRNEAIE